MAHGDTIYLWMDTVRRTIGSFLDERHAEQLLQPIETPACSISYKNYDAWDITVLCGSGEVVKVYYLTLSQELLKLLEKHPE